MPDAAVSVILPTRNRAHCLEPAVRSVLDQDGLDLELIVVDDASTDGTATMLDQIRDSRLRVERRTVAGGAPAARNAGVRLASSEIVAFQDSDTVWLPGSFRPRVRRLVDAPADVAVSYGVTVKHVGTQVLRFPEQDRSPLDGDLTAALLLENFIDLPSAVVWRAALEAVGGFDERLPRLQDWDLWLNLASAGWRFAHVAVVSVETHDSPDSLTRDHAAWFEAIELLLDKHARLFAGCPPAEIRYRLQLARRAGSRGRFLTMGRELARAASRDWRVMMSAVADRGRRAVG